MSGAKNPYAKPDHFSRKAKDEGYAARSVYKLQEIDQRFRVLKPNQRVLDLGCSPGSWSAYARQKIGKNGTLVGVDLTETSLAGTFLLGSIYDIPLETLRDALGGGADLVLSDMAPLTIGEPLADHVNQLELASCARDLAFALLSPGGSFVCKVFDGEDANAFVVSARARFADVKRVRPEAVRKVSREFFLVATGFSRA